MMRGLLGDAQAVEESPEFTQMPSPVSTRPRRSSPPADHLDDRQVELLRELPVALVVGGHGHDGAGAVGREHVVGDPDRDAGSPLTGLMA
jgi:hypothetical protein